MHTKAKLLFDEDCSLLAYAHVKLSKWIDKFLHIHFIHIDQIETLPTTDDDEWESIFIETRQGLYPIFECIAKHRLDN